MSFGYGWLRDVWSSNARRWSKDICTASWWYMDEDGVAYPSLGLLASGDPTRPTNTHCTTTKSLLAKHLAEPVEDGWLYIDRIDLNPGRGDVNVYVATWPHEWAKGVESAPFRARDLAGRTRVKLQSKKGADSHAKGCGSTRKKGADLAPKGAESTPEVLQELQAVEEVVEGRPVSDASLNGLPSTIDSEHDYLVARLLDVIGDHGDAGTPHVVCTHSRGLSSGSIAKVIESTLQNDPRNRAAYAVTALQNELEERSA